MYKTAFTFPSTKMQVREKNSKLQTIRDLFQPMEKNKNESFFNVLNKLEACGFIKMHMRH